MPLERIRRLITIVEDVYEVSGKPLDPPKRVVVAAAVIANPHVGEFIDDVGPWVADVSEDIGRTLADRLMDQMPDEVQSHGKGVVVGEAGDLELGSAIIHTLRFGNRLRERSGATTLLPAVEKVAPMGASVDIPLRHTQDSTMRSHRETFTVQLPTAPLPDEIVVYVAATNAERPHARIGVYTGDESTS